MALKILDFTRIRVCVGGREVHTESRAIFWKNHKGKAKQKGRSATQCLMSRCREVRVESGMKTPRNQIN